MQDTEKYLNSILQKRLGSVVNQNSVNKNANTVTRLPRKQQRLESMPTVFRKKQQTVYRVGSQQYGSKVQNPYLQYQNRNTNTNPYKSNQYRTQIINEQQNWQEANESNSSRTPKQSQRVQYMLISKRIQAVKGFEKVPTVDVSKYHKQEIEQQRERTKYFTKNNKTQGIQQQYLIETNKQIQQPNFIINKRLAQKNGEQSKLPMHVPAINPKRKRIFGNKKQESHCKQQDQ